MNTDIRSLRPDFSIAGRAILMGLLVPPLLLLSVNAAADVPPDVPSNEELYQMIQQLQDEAEKARREAEAAQRELAAIKQAPPVVVPSGVTEERDPAFFARLENTFMSYGQEGGAADAAGGTADFGNDYTPRLELGYVGSQGIGIRGRYWRYDDSESTDSANNDKVKVDSNYYDLELFQQWQVTDKTELEGAIGVRWLKFNQGASNNAINREVDSDFNGYGATLAVQAKRKWGIGKVYGRSRLSVLLGEHDIQHINTATNTVLTDVDAEDDPVSQLELTFGYEVARELPWGTLNANLGYEWQYWTNVAPANTVFGGIGNGDVLEDASFRGFVLGVGAEF